MADTWGIWWDNYPLGSGTPIGVLNGSGSGVVLRVYRIMRVNMTTTAVTGASVTFNITRFTSWTGGTAITPVPYDPDNTALPAQVAAKYGATSSGDVVVSRHAWHTEEVNSTATNGLEEAMSMWPFGLVLDIGYECNSSIEPLVAREGYGYHMDTSTATNVDIGCSMEFTRSAS